jgi:hypothetical protein
MTHDHILVICLLTKCVDRKMVGVPNLRKSFDVKLFLVNKIRKIQLSWPPNKTHEELM